MCCFAPVSINYKVKKMKTIPILLSVTLMSLFFSCNNATEKNKNESASKEKTQKEAKTDESVAVEEEEEAELTLNNGKKWKVNAEMIPYINEGDSLINDFIEQKRDDYQVLGMSLSVVNSNLVASCTLPGDDPNHIALHKWLKPHLKKTKALKTFISDAISAQAFNQVVESYKTFHTYFESEK